MIKGNTIAQAWYAYQYTKGLFLLKHFKGSSAVVQPGFLLCLTEPGAYKLLTEHIKEIVNSRGDYNFYNDQTNGRPSRWLI